MFIDYAMRHFTDHKMEYDKDGSRLLPLWVLVNKLIMFTFEQFRACTRCQN